MGQDRVRTGWSRKNKFGSPPRSLLTLSQEYAMMVMVMIDLYHLLLVVDAAVDSDDVCTPFLLPRHFLRFS